MNPVTPAIALLYDDSGYVEAVRPGPAGIEHPMGLVGRQVAGREFLDAYLRHGDYRQLTAVVYHPSSAATLTRLCGQHPRAAQAPLRIVEVDRFLDRRPTAEVSKASEVSPAAPVLYTPCPPDASFAWMRRERGPTGFALSGVTHTLCSAGAVRLLGDLVTAPFEPFDALICTSTAVVRMVRAVTGAYADHLCDRFGGNPTLRPRLAHIPLGVNPERFRPATADERAQRRRS